MARKRTSTNNGFLGKIGKMVSIAADSLLPSIFKPRGEAGRLEKKIGQSVKCANELALDLYWLVRTQNQSNVPSSIPQQDDTSEITFEGFSGINTKGGNWQNQLAQSDSSADISQWTPYNQSQGVSHTR